MVMRLAARDEIGGHHLRALVQHLEERVLPVRAGRAPYDRARRVIDGLAVARHALAVAFHLELLQVIREALEPHVVRQHRVRRGAEEVAVPHAEQRHDDRHVALERRAREMLVHAARAVAHRFVLVHADGDRDRQPDRRPQRIAAADPVPEFENALLADPECLCCLRVRRHRGKMFSSARSNRFRKPGPYAIRVGQRFLRRESLGRDDGERRLRIEISRARLRRARRRRST